jgi:hypothetical protein
LAPLGFSMPLVVSIVLWLIAWGLVLHLIVNNVSWLCILDFPKKLDFMYFGIIAPCVALYPLFISSYGKEQAHRLTGVLRAERPFFAHLAAGRGLVVQIAAVHVRFTVTDGQPIPALAPYLSFIVERDPAGYPLVTTTVLDPDDRVIVKIRRNHWEVSDSKLVVWDKNYNESTLELQGRSGSVVFQIHLYQNRVEFAGSWLTRIGVDRQKVRLTFRAVGNSAEIMAQRPDDVQPPISPIFCYPSEEHWGEICNQAYYASLND